MLIIPRMNMLKNNLLCFRFLILTKTTQKFCQTLEYTMCLPKLLYLDCMLPDLGAERTHFSQ